MKFHYQNASAGGYPYKTQLSLRARVAAINILSIPLSNIFFKCQSEPRCTFISNREFYFPIFKGGYLNKSGKTEMF